jgi:hypothetical protein
MTRSLYAIAAGLAVLAIATVFGAAPAFAADHLAHLPAHAHPLLTMAIAAGLGAARLERKETTAPTWPSRSRRRSSR